MLCPKCGSELNNNAKFCSECGTKIEKNEAFAMADMNIPSSNKTGFGDDPYAANNITFAPKTESSKIETPKSETEKPKTEKTEEAKTEEKVAKSETAEPEQKKSKFSVEGIVGFAISIGAFYLSVFGCFIAAVPDEPVLHGIGIFILLLGLGAEITALCLCNVGAKKAELRVFCLIGRGISIFSICWIGLILLIFTSWLKNPVHLDLSKLGRIL